MAEPTEPRFRGWRTRTQPAKPQTNAEHSRTTATAVKKKKKSVAVPQPTTRLVDPPPPAFPGPAARHPRVGSSPRASCSRGISRLSPEARGKRASPAGKPGTHVRGRGQDEEAGLRHEGRSIVTREEGGVQRPVDRRCSCPDRPLGLGCARTLCAGLETESGGVAVRLGCVSVRLSRRRGCRREAEPGQWDWKATAPGGRAWGESREPPLGRGRRTLVPTAWPRAR